MIGSSCLKPFHAAVMCALVASTQPLNFPIMSWKNWKVGTALSVPSPTCTWVEFKVSVGALSRLYFLYLNMLSFFSVLLTLENHLWIKRLQVWQSIEFIPTPLKHTPQGHLTLLVGFWALPFEPSILVLPTFIVGMFSKPVTECLSLLNYHSWWQDQLHIGASKGSQHNIHERASITIIKSSWLKTETWCTPTVTSTSHWNSHLPLLLSLHHCI